VVHEPAIAATGTGSLYLAETRIPEAQQSAIVCAMTALIASLFFTVILLVITTYFILGAVPLLVLKHDTPLDYRFIRGFFNTYYRMAMYVAGGTALSYGFAGRPFFAVGAALLALLAIVLRRTIISKMDSIGSRIRGNPVHAIPGFRRIHVTAILLNITQLVLIVWALTTLSLR
jgi:hypothetical protein